MSKTIHISLKQPAEQLIQQAKAAAARNGVTMEGDAAGGRFAGSGIQGQYAVAGDTLSITISKKPLIMPWAFIEQGVTAFFA
ncbi:hypothetical protein [Methylogaea oryzae]|nr:hypothetical protein [Methylogaea oryzae]